MTTQDILRHPKTDKYQQQHGNILALIPLKNDQDDIIGVVAIEQINFLHFHAANLQLMQLIVDWASRSILSKQLFSSAQEKLIFDNQNGLYYFHYLNIVLSKEFERAKIYNLDLSILMIKIDQFGFYETTIQDLLKRTLISVIKSTMSSFDMLFHYKYDGMFIALLPMKKKKELELFLNQLLKEFAATLQSLKTQMQVPEITIKSSSFDGKTKTANEFLTTILDEVKRP